TFDYSHFGRSDFKLTDAFAELGEREQALADCCIYWEKNLYVMNNNAARNFALRHGRGRADWVMPWDGNCFLTSDGWAAIYEAIRHAGAARYLIVPMYRLVRNDDVFAVHPAGPAEDPQ